MPKLSPTDQAAIEVARLSFPVYMAIVHETDMPWHDSGKALPAAHHMEMMRALTDQKANTLILEPRGAAKTAIIQGFIEWSFGRASISGDKDWAKRYRVLHLSHAATQSFTVSLAIMETITDNATYQAIFPDVKPHPKKWSEPEWRLKGNTGSSHANFKAGGIESPPLGGRFDLIILDDIADMENMATDAARDKIRLTLNRTVSKMLPPWGRFIMPCTRWDYDDPAQWAMDRGWTTITQKAIVLDEDGNEHSFWPERFPLTDAEAIEMQERLNLDKVPDSLHKQRREDPRGFAQQMQNEVTPEEGLVFNRAWFSNRFSYLVAEAIWRIESWDLAQTAKRKSDWSVGLHTDIVPTCPICPNGYWHYFLPHMFRAKQEYGLLKSSIKTVYDLMGGLSNNHYAVIEKKSAGDSLAGEGLWGVNLDFMGALGDGRGGPEKREANLRDVLEVCRQGRVHFPTDDYLRRTHEDWLPELESALYSWDGDAAGHTDDIVIAFVQAIVWGELRKQEHQRMIAQPRADIPWARQQRTRQLA